MNGKLWRFFVQVCINFTVLTLLISIERAITGHGTISIRAIPQMALVIALCVGANWLVSGLLQGRAALSAALNTVAILAIVFTVGGGIFRWFDASLAGVLYGAAFTLLCGGIVTLLYVLKGRRDARRINAIIREEGRGNDSDA